MTMGIDRELASEVKRELEEEMKPSGLTFGETKKYLLVTLISTTGLREEDFRIEGDSSRLSIYAKVYDEWKLMDMITLHGCRKDVKLINEVAEIMKDNLRKLV